MSFFSLQITVPKNTLSTAPVSQTLEIQHGIIHRVYIRIPPGHGGLTGVHILQGLHQISPTSGSEWWCGDDMQIDYGEHIEALESPFLLTIEAYNIDDTYSHTFVIGVGVLPEWVILPQTILKELLAGISEILANMAKWFGIKGGAS